MTTMLNIPSISQCTPIDPDPVLIKLMSGEELVARVFLPAYADLEDASIVLLQRPLQVITVFGNAQINTFYKKWLIYASGDVVSVPNDGIMTFTNVTPTIAAEYDWRAERFYTEPDHRTEEELTRDQDRAKTDAYTALLNAVPVDDSKLN